LRLFAQPSADTLPPARPGQPINALVTAGAKDQIFRRRPAVCRLRLVSFREMKVPSLLALDAGHCPISESRIGFSIQGYPNRKAAGYIVSNDLNSGNRFATGPLPHGLKAFSAKRPVVQADRFEFYHLKLLLETKAFRGRANRRRLTFLPDS
jgi:hypothetical protein